MNKILEEVLDSRKRNALTGIGRSSSVMAWTALLAFHLNDVSEEAHKVFFRDALPGDYRKGLIDMTAACLDALEALDATNA